MSENQAGFEGVEEPKFFEGNRIVGYTASLSKAGSFVTSEPHNVGDVLELRSFVRVVGVNHKTNREDDQPGMILTVERREIWELDPLVEVVNVSSVSAAG